MKRLLLLSATLISLSCTAQTGDEKAWMEFMTPGDEHAMLAKADGKWDEEITFYMDPSAPPATAKSTCVNEMIMGGRYQKSTHTGDMMGMPFEGSGITGYDKGRKIWFSTWIDNMGTGVMYSEGTYDKVKKLIEFKGTCTDPATGKPMKFRQTFKSIDNDHQEMEMFMVHNGKEFKSMVIRLNRAK